MDILRQIAVVLGAVAFLAVCWWAFSPKRRKRFEEDAKLPFADEELSQRSAEAADDKDTEENSAAVNRGDAGSAPADKNKGQDEK
ncbi:MULTISPECIES: cbb3-type cytochrome c oxidase subunit 3 [Microbulbifer]|uniref:cbb3-type cytochrome oxidase subunit 3 n=1 Tax=Microbulbifer TaxID=48073 RepID=UPI001E41A07B|nr:MULTISPECIES: cbb3-type cytochrome c oxidase subunit 3 [Microbulbifer]UHQ56286.1 cbb3-type cytochrome c oxidase subunit 3 [Microbulbifer sp. YPW16]